ncbi:GIY-YIG nuclease family protein [Blastococcus sp. SYSU DS0753]
MTDALAVANELCGPAADAEGAGGQIPRGSGLYAWWARATTLPGVSGPAHPGVEGPELLYIGLARDLRARVVGNHFRGPTGSSTLRRVLVALLMPSEGYTTRWTTDRVVPVDADEARLSEWMRTPAGDVGGAPGTEGGGGGRHRRVGPAAQPAGQQGPPVVRDDQRRGRPTAPPPALARSPPAGRRRDSARSDRSGRRWWHLFHLATGHHEP